MDESSNSQEPSNNRVAIRHLESRFIPENGPMLTFRERYDTLDKKLIALTGMEQLPKGTQISVLDFAGGVLSFGSPTAHDLVDKIEDIGIIPQVTVVDKHIPQDLKPNYPEVAYFSSLDQVDGSFDVIRALNFIGYVRQDEYQKIRADLIKQLKEGGLFLCTQALKRYRENDDDVMELPHISKIMQKRNGRLIPIALLPNPILTTGRLIEQATVDKIKEAASRGALKPIESQEDLEENIEMLNRNATANLRGLEEDDITVSPYANDKNDIVRLLRINSEDTARLFTERHVSVDSISRLRSIRRKLLGR